jgi:hypothetical protein
LRKSQKLVVFGIVCNRKDLLFRTSRYSRQKLLDCLKNNLELLIVLRFMSSILFFRSLWLDFPLTLALSRKGEREDRSRTNEFVRATPLPQRGEGVLSPPQKI